MPYIAVVTTMHTKNRGMSVGYEDEALNVPEDVRGAWTTVRRHEIAFSHWRRRAVKRLRWAVTVSSLQLHLEVEDLFWLF